MPLIEHARPSGTLLFLCRGQLADLETRRTSLCQEIGGYEKLLETDLESLDADFLAKSIQRGLGNLSPAWVAILARLSKFKHFNASDVILISRELNKQQDTIKIQSHGNVRFQLSAYVKSRLIDRLGNGDYRVSDKTRIALELIAVAKSSLQIKPNEFGPELAALAQERRVTPANPSPTKA
jgi:hypothetical protein